MDFENKKYQLRIGNHLCTICGHVWGGGMDNTICPNVNKIFNFHTWQRILDAIKRFHNRKSIPYA